MAAIPNQITDAIYKVYSDANAKESARTYLGCSELGEECSRRLFYSFRHVARQEFEGRILRLFNSGHREEDRIIADLRAAGFTVHNRDEKGHQFGYSECDGHLRGHIDGVIEGLIESDATHLLEIKTSGEKSFRQLEKDGCEKTKPVHFAQIQLYLGMTELTRALYVVVNKNTDEIYTERIKADATMYKALLLKAKRIIRAESAPDKIGKDASFYKCRFCPFSEHCHGDLVADVNCMTCVHSKPVEDGKWECGRGLTMAEDCTEHILVPDLVPFARPIDGDQFHIVYDMVDGRKFANVAGTSFDPKLLESDMPLFASSEVKAIDPKAIGNKEVEMARSILGGKIVEKDSE